MPSPHCEDLFFVTLEQEIKYREYHAQFFLFLDGDALAQQRLYTRVFWTGSPCSAAGGGHPCRAQPSQYGLGRPGIVANHLTVVSEIQDTAKARNSSVEIFFRR